MPINQIGLCQSINLFLTTATTYFYNDSNESHSMSRISCCKGDNISPVNKKSEALPVNHQTKPTHNEPLFPTQQVISPSQQSLRCDITYSPASNSKSVLPPANSRI